MRRLGICQKCGEEKIVQDHHLHGYGGEHKDEVVPYCRSCDLKAHNKARKEGKCFLSGEEAHRKTYSSYERRSIKHKMLSSETVMKNVRLFEQIQINLNTGHICVSSHFSATKGMKILYIGDKK